MTIDSLSVNQRRLHEKLLKGFLLSANGGLWEFCLHPPVNSGIPDTAEPVHFTVGRGLLRRNLLVESHRGPNGVRIFYAAKAPRE